MRAMSKTPHIFTYGHMFSKIKREEAESATDLTSALRDWHSKEAGNKQLTEYLLVSSSELDDSFAVAFRRHATELTRLIVFHDEGTSTDTLFSKMVDMQIRTSQRCYLIDAKFSHEKTDYSTLVASILKRLRSVLSTKDQRERILYARIENEILHVVSHNFVRLDVPVSKINEFRKLMPDNDELEIDENGSFIFWPSLDVHLGWDQLQQLVNPEAALKASQRNKEFNVRYGKAVEHVRKAVRLSPSEIGLSKKQLDRIENGECRITPNAIAKLAAAHKLTPNEYLKELANNLK